MENPKISVIVPIFNQERYLRKCIQSIVSQSFRDLEIILVNDGSSDTSLEICKEFARQDGRIIIIDKPNEGLASARRDGVLGAKGQYIYFADSDDYLDCYAIERLYNIACRQKADVVVGNFDKVLDNRGWLKKKKQDYYITDRLVGKDELRELFIGGGCQLVTLAWGRLYRMECFKRALEAHADMLFPPNKAPGEDRFMNLILTPFLNSLWVTNEVLYYYRFGGMTTRYFPVIKDGGSYFDVKYEMCKEYGLAKSLPQVFSYYMGDLYFDLRQQIHFNVSTEKELRDFINTELNSRKIVTWAKDNLPDDYRRKPDVAAILNKDIDGILNITRQKENDLWKHYLLVNVLKWYQKHF